MSKVIFGDEDEPGGVLVDPVDNPGPFFSTDPGEAFPAVPEQGIDKCAVRVPGSRVDDHAARLVYNDEIRIFIDNVQGKILRNERDIGSLCRQRDGYGVTGLNLCTLPDSFVIQQNKAVLGQPLSCRAAEAVHSMREESVDSFSALLCCDIYDFSLHAALTELVQDIVQ